MTSESATQRSSSIVTGCSGILLPPSSVSAMCTYCSYILRPCSPYASYTWRLRGVDSTLYAVEISWNLAVALGSLLRSGW